MNSKGVSPLVATLLLIIFSVLLGWLTMHLGQSYIEDIGPEDAKPSFIPEEITYINGLPYTCATYDDSGDKCVDWELAS